MKDIYVTPATFLTQLKKLHKKVIPIKLVKRFDNLIVDYLQENFNNCLKNCTLYNYFKKAVVHLTQKKDCKTEKSNYQTN